MALAIGQTLQHRYQIRSILGQGGMGVVYQACDPVLQRIVAIKVLPPQLTVDAEFVSRFQREAVASANLSHPHIVTVYDVGQQDGEYFIIMEYLEGNTLEQWLKQHGPMPVAQVSQVLDQIASALDHAHGRGIIHRDVKPSNIMLDSHDRAVLMDFGLVRSGEGLGPTRSTTVMGTPEYMAPEQILGQAIDRRTDIYALGVVIYELLSGKTPFAHTTPIATAYAHVHEAPPPVRSVNKTVSQPVEAVVMKALAKDPVARYQSAGDMACDFSQAIGDVMPAGLTAAPAGATDRKKQTTSPAGGTAAAAAKRGRPRAGALLATSALALVVVLLAVVLWPRGGAVGDSAESSAPAIVMAVTTTDTPSPIMIAVVSTSMATALPTVTAVEAAARAVLVDTAAPTSTSSAPPARLFTATPIPTDTATPTSTRMPTQTPTSAATATPFVTTNARIRSCPSTNCSEVRMAAAGTIIPAVCSVTEADGVWYKLVNNQGWVRSDVATLSGRLVSCPVAAVTPTPPVAVVSSGSSSSSSSSSASSGGSCRAAGSLPPVALGAPASDKTCNGPVRFSWQAPYTLQSGEMFEVHIWANLNQNRGNVRRTRDTSAVIDLRRDVPWINWTDPHRAHFWEVVVVCQTTNTKLSQESGARLFYFETRMPVDENNPDNNCR